jgi:hypothetical protein
MLWEIGENLWETCGAMAGRCTADYWRRRAAEAELALSWMREPAARIALHQIIAGYFCLPATLRARNGTALQVVASRQEKAARPGPPVPAKDFGPEHFKQRLSASPHKPCRVVDGADRRSNHVAQSCAAVLRVRALTPSTPN